MYRLLLLLVLLFAAPIGAQEAETGESSQTEPSTDAESVDDSAEVSDADEVGESDTYFEEDQDDFIPSDEVTYEQSVPFPTDI